jgi:multidrug transporter EmrE-like cation transporter
MSWLYVLATITFTTIGQLLIKWQLGHSGPMPSQSGPMLVFLVRQLFSAPVILGFAAAFVAALSWMAALTKFQLNLIYPFMSLSFPLTMVLSAYFFGEDLSWTKAAGMAVILIGLFILTR